MQYHSDNQKTLNPKYFDPIFKENADIIAAVSYITPDASNINEAGLRKSRVTDKARINKKDTNIYGVQPGIFDATIPEFNKPHYVSDSALTLGEQLYTAKGSQSAGVGAYIADVVNVDPSDYKQSMVL